MKWALYGAQCLDNWPYRRFSGGHHKTLIFSCQHLVCVISACVLYGHVIVVSVQFFVCWEGVLEDIFFTGCLGAIVIPHLVFRFLLFTTYLVQHRRTYVLFAKFRRVGQV